MEHESEFCVSPQTDAVRSGTSVGWIDALTGRETAGTGRSRCHLPPPRSAAGIRRQKKSLVPSGASQDSMPIPGWLFAAWLSQLGVVSSRIGSCPLFL